MKRLATLLAIATLAGSASAQLHRKAPSPSGSIDGQSPLPPTPFLPDLTPGYVVIEGDIQVRMEHYIAILSGLDSTFGTVTYWPGGIVPYDFVTSGGGAVSGPNQAAAISAMNAIASRAGVTFRPATGSDFNRIRFQNSGFNNSPVGMQGTGPQIINIVSWGNQIIVCHELFHSLGFWHEQSRSDRNSFITIVTSNICGSGSSTACTAGSGAGQCCQCIDTANQCTSCVFAFDLQPGAISYGLYDFDSFMHYGPTAFTCNGLATITVNPPFTNAIGQRDHFSYYDRITCRGLYPFAADRWVDRGHVGSQLGTFLQPTNDPNIHTRAQSMPTGGTLFIKFGNTYSGVGIYTNPITIEAPAGAVTIGN